MFRLLYWQTKLHDVAVVVVLVVVLVADDVLQSKENVCRQYFGYTPLRQIIGGVRESACLSLSVCVPSESVFATFEGGG